MSTWYCITTTPSGEYRAKATLRRAGYAVYLPERRIERQHRRTKTWSEFRLPLLPGYLFVDMAPGQRWPTLLGCDGVRGALTALDGEDESLPCQIASGPIEALMAAQMAMEFDDTRAARARRKIDLWPVGSKVQIVDGPFAQLAGEVAWHNDERIEVLVQLLGRMTPVALDIGQVRMAA